MKKHFSFSVSFLVLLCLVIAYSLHVKAVKKRAIVESRLIGDDIIIALEAYYTDNEIYPQDLGMLCPRYVKSLRRPLLKCDTWFYQTNGGAFELAFKERCDSYEGAYYNSTDKEWYEDY